MFLQQDREVHVNEEKQHRLKDQEISIDEETDAIPASYWTSGGL
jgi:hypothetical protein